ncbi:mannitol-1-phosphate dehydrogenase M1PDH1 [Imleria badia]|nr:mannitol-1-phosphate dehydrogenase M1PDH1 [Imleria badia]
MALQLETLPTVQRVAQIHTFGEPLSILSAYPVPDPAQLRPNECLVKIEYAGVCQSDLHARNGDWLRKPTLPRIGGHEGAGIIVAIGAGTLDSPVSLGDRVGLKWIARSCLHCENCRMGNESSCSSRLAHGYTTDGTFAEYAVAWTYYVTPIPKSLDSAAATSILCAGLTVYKGLKRINVPTGSWIALPGAGGGLGHLAIQYAVAMGLRVIAIDSGEEKRKLCLALGAEKWIDFKESGDALVQNVVAAADGLGPQAALISAGAAAPYAQACYYVRATGTIICIGVPSTPFQAPFELLVGKELKLIGSSVGTRQDAIEALDIAARGKVTCHYTLRRLEELETVFDEMKRGEIVGRVVLKV